MSILFNQTNIAPGSAFATGGGGGGIAASLISPPLIVANPVLSDEIRGSFDPYSAENILCVSQSSSGNLAPLQIGGFVEVQPAGTQPTTALWRTLYQSDGTTFVAQDSGTSYILTQINRAGPQSFSGVALTNVSTINGAVPALGGSGPKIEFGSLQLSNNGQQVVYSEPFATTPSVLLTPTGNGAGVNGFFQVNNSSTYLTAFQVFYSGELIYGPIEVNWMAVGT